MGRKFRNPITVQGVESDDHRILHNVEFRELPLALQWSPTGGGHDNAVPVGVLSNVWLEDNLWWGEGEYLEDDAAADAAVLRAEAGAAFLSVIPSSRMEYRELWIDPATGEMADPAEIEKVANAVWADMDEDGSGQAWLESLYMRTEFDLYEVAAITQLDTACFHECRVALTDDTAEVAAPERVAASAEQQERASLVLRRIAAGPATRPAFAYAERTYARYTPFTISDEGVIAGHLCGWNSCHRGFHNRCERPQYQTEFPDFHTQWAPLDDGRRVRVGVITTVKGHLRTAAEFDEVASDPRCQLGTVRLYADKFGIQLSGTCHPDVTPEQMTRALASTPSGDWRGPEGARKLFGIALVNTGGYVPNIIQEDEDFHRMIASIPAPVDDPSLEGVFFDTPVSVLTAACACESNTEPVTVANDCGCGGHEGACTCDQRLAPRDLADLADLDHAFRRIKTRA